MTKNILSKLFCFFILLFSTCIQAFPKGGEAHRRDMIFVLGFYNSSEKGQVSINKDFFMPLVELINVMIDDGPNMNYSKQEYKIKPTGKIFYICGTNAKWTEEHIYNNFEGFVLSNGHRMMFHWGMEDDPRNVQALIDCFDKWYYKKEQMSPLYYDYDNWKENFFSVIELEQLKRKNILIEAVETLFSLPHTGSSDDFSSSIAGILYYVHLIGDHIKHSTKTISTVEAVLNMNAIEAGLDKYMKTLSKKGTLIEYNQYKTSIKIYAHSIKDDRKRAAQTLKILGEYTPKILKRAYPGVFDKLTNSRGEKIKFVTYDRNYDVYKEN